MALFARKEKKRIAELEAAVVSEQEALQTEMAVQQSARRSLQQSLNKEKAETERLQADIAEMQVKAIEDRAALTHEHEVEVAALSAQIDLLKDKAAKYDALLQGFIWHTGGQVEIEGKLFVIKEARTDNPLANFRLPVPEGQEFP